MFCEVQHSYQFYQRCLIRAKRDLVVTDLSLSEPHKHTVSPLMLQEPKHYMISTQMDWLYMFIFWVIWLK